MHNRLERAAVALNNARLTLAFTGAGISVESGIAPFRGPGGLYEKVDPTYFDKRYFVNNPEKAWPLIKEHFYDMLDLAKPNAAHIALANLEQQGLLHAVITQNIDGLHQAGGSVEVYEFHGGMTRLDCLSCRVKTPAADISLDELPPSCPLCGGLLKPDIVFFGEPIPDEPMRFAFDNAERCDALIVVGTSGEVQPAARIPLIAKNAGATIIEVNVRPSPFTESITDIFLEGPASQMLQELQKAASAL